MSETQTDGQQIAEVIPPAVVATDTAESTEPVSITTEESTPEPRQAPKPAGYHPIDFKTATPEQIQERFDYVYGQVKHTERDKREMRQILQQQSAIIDQLSQGQQQVVQHLTQQSFNDGKEQLKVAMQDAWKKGDNAAYIEAQNKLMDLQVEERIAQKMQRNQPAEKPRVPVNAYEVAAQAAQNGELSDDEYRMTDAWQSERDASGNLLRPWAHSSSPDYQFAWREAQAVFSNPKFTSYEQRLAEMDRRMGTVKPPAGRTVMGGSLTKPTKTTKIELTPKQREIALKTQYAGKGKSEADHLEKYRQQIEKFSSKRAK